MLNIRRESWSFIVKAVVIYMVYYSTKRVIFNKAYTKMCTNNTSRTLKPLYDFFSEFQWRHFALSSSFPLHHKGPSIYIYSTSNSIWHAKCTHTFRYSRQYWLNQFQPHHERRGVVRESNAHFSIGKHLYHISAIVYIQHDSGHRKNGMHTPR